MKRRPSPLHVLVQMDPLEGIDVNGDSTFRIMREARSREHRVCVARPEHLALDEGVVSTWSSPVKLQRDASRPFVRSPSERRRLTDFDVILLRQDPPFDMHYVTTTHLLEAASTSVRIVNDPFWVRNAPEKILVTQFSDLMPPTLITRARDAIDSFRDRHGDIVIKPLYGNGGEGVFRVREGDSNYNPLLETLFAQRREALVVQAFLPTVLSEGDRRLILIDGKLAGGILRIPAKGEARSNMHVGGRAERWTPTDRDRAICERVGPLLRERGLVFAGLDVIGDCLTEINVTSPTGMQELERLDGINAAALFWDAVERRVLDQQ